MDQHIIIFLDIDGVINCRSFLRKNRPTDEHDLSTWAAMMCPEMVARINRITDATGAKIVIVSDWRKHGSEETLFKTIREGGITGEIIGSTREVNERRRDIEIAEWIGRTFGWDNAETLKFIAIDDNPHLYPSIRGRVIQTSFRNQFLEPDFLNQV